MTTSPETLALLAGAAELRAAGTPWAETATQLSVDPGELQQLKVEHSRDYDRLARRARIEFLRETLDAAIAALRVLLKSPEPGVSLAAATTIVRYDMASMRNRRSRSDSRRPTRSRLAASDDFDSCKLRARNVSESTGVTTSKEVVAAEKVANSRAPATAPSGAPRPIPVDETGRARERLVDAMARGHVAPLAKGRSQTLEVDRLMRKWLTE